MLDEYGGTAGLITLEDILEEIVGEYEDEFTPRHRHIKKEDETHFIIDGGVRVTELEPKLNFPFPTGDYVTLGGLIYNRLGRIPAIGDLVELTLEVTSDPAGARVQVNEVARGITPCRVADLNVNEEHAIRIDLAGYEPVQRSTVYEEIGAGA